MLGLCVAVTCVSVALSATVIPWTTTSTAMPITTTISISTANAKILYDDKHHKAMIVVDSGCYEYHMDHQDVLDSQQDSTRALLEARMLSALQSATDVQETGHHHIDHMTQEIRSACALLPVYQFA